MRNKGQKEKHKKYQQIIKAIQPIIKKFGKEDVRLAVNRWEAQQREKNRLIKQKREIEERLSEI